MLTGVRSVGIHAGDQDRARRFWTETMDFSAGMHAPMTEDPNGPRWIEVVPPDRSVILVLFTPPEIKDRIGEFSNIIFTCDNIRQTYEELCGRGVEFSDAPRQEPWGWWAVFKDPDGNSYGLSQRQ